MNAMQSSNPEEVVGTENGRPLMSIQFRDKRVAQRYKTVARVVSDAVQQAPENDSAELEDIDLKLDIWPKDFEASGGNADGLFVIDTEPKDRELRRYSQILPLLSDNVEKLQNYISSAPRGGRCLNCNGSHILGDCPFPRNYRAIDEWRKAVAASVGQHHVEDGQHLLPGRNGPNLREVFKMGELGYPPGLSEAKICEAIDQWRKAVQPLLGFTISDRI